MSERPQVVIIGGGFGGLAAARELEFANVEVTLVDRQNHHLFQPLLYQVATAGLSAPDIASPIRKILSGNGNVTVLLDEVVSIDRRGQRASLSMGRQLEYDYLIVAAGMRNHYFGNDSWEAHAPGLKSLDDALEIRRRVILAYEAAERELDVDAREPWLTFVVVGAGPTGVEMAGALQEIAVQTMYRNFRNFDPRQVRVHLVEGQDQVLKGMPSETLRRKAHAQLDRLGVDVMLNTRVESIDSGGITTTDGRRIAARTVVWAAGVRAASLVDRMGVEQDRQGRVVVQPSLSVAGDERVFAIGDVAACVDAEGVSVPGMAPAAVQMGRHAAWNIKRAIKGTELLPFTYVDKGQMATIGRSKAVAMTGPFEISGYVAWLSWLFVHIMVLVGFRNRLAVLFEWAWAYVTYQRSARVVVGLRWGQKPTAEAASGGSEEE